MGIVSWLTKRMTNFLTHEDNLGGSELCDFDRLSFEIRPCDVLLVEGRSRVSNVIKNITVSPWTHAALYIGRIHEIENETDREIIKKYYKGDPGDQLLIEALLGEGTIIVPLTKYSKDHIRICRPQGLARQDANKVTLYALQNVGGDYNVRQLFDLARFMLPYSFLPKEWGSTLFNRANVGDPTKTVCSSMIASAFTSVHFPILPVVHKQKDGSLKMFKRNTRLYTPPDFDYSPYFEIIKYAIMGFDDLAVYRKLPWDKNGVICNGENDCYIPDDHPALNPAAASEAVPDDKKTESKDAVDTENDKCNSDNDATPEEQIENKSPNICFILHPGLFPGQPAYLDDNLCSYPGHPQLIR